MLAWAPWENKFQFDYDVARKDCYAKEVSSTGRIEKVRCERQELTPDQKNFPVEKHFYDNSRNSIDYNFMYLQHLKAQRKLASTLLQHWARSLFTGKLA